MAERRMFAKQIIDSDAFLDMPMSARLLYYDLGMRADDDGFVNSPKKIMRVVGASMDDINILISKKFIIPLDGGLIVVKHWNINNRIRKDMYHPTTYTDEKKLLGTDENGAYFLLRTDSVQIPYENRTDPLPNKVNKDNLISLGEVERSAEPQQRPLDELQDNQIAGIVYEWNMSTVTKNVTGIHHMTTRENNTRLCLGRCGFQKMLDIIQSLEHQAWFKKRKEANDPVTFDWFIKPDNFQKVLEGNYAEERKKPEPEKPKTKFQNFDERSYDDDYYAELERKMMGE